METVTTSQLIALIISGGLAAAVFNKLFDYITGKKKTEQITLLDVIERRSDKIVAQGWRTHNQTRMIQEAYQQYKKRGGNGYADSLLHDAMAMPSKGDEVE